MWTYLSDPGPLEAMLRAAMEAGVPKCTDDPEELLRQEWRGLCYTATVRWVSNRKNAEWVLVHGKVGDERVGKRVDHAWCEHEDQVVDLTMPMGSRIFQREEYYQIFKPEVKNIYSSEDAILLTIKNGHDGPWEEWEQLIE